MKIPKMFKVSFVELLQSDRGAGAGSSSRPAEVWHSGKRLAEEARWLLWTHWQQRIHTRSRRLHGDEGGLVL